MLILLSPAKTLDMESPTRVVRATQPAFLDESEMLVTGLQRYSKKKLGALMSISEALSATNVARFASWQRPFNASNAKAAIEVFRGDVYTGFDVDSLPKRELAQAQKYLRILSGLYGVLKPLDLIQAYRLEMGTRLKTRSGDNLYKFWGDRITDHLNQELVEMPKPLLVNLASNEYFKAVSTRKLHVPPISPVFRDEKNGDYKIISFYAKKARGAMARYLIEQRVNAADDLRGFDVLGYRYSAKSSSNGQPVFLRTEKVAARHAA
ncbi:MAG: peroxide stress protein YaaA [Granulosicoccus sp.]